MYKPWGLEQAIVTFELQLDHLLVKVIPSTIQHGGSAVQSMSSRQQLPSMSGALSMVYGTQ